MLLCQITMVTHPHPNPPLEGEGIFSRPLKGREFSAASEGEGIFGLLPLQGGGREGDGVRKRNAMLKCDKVELVQCHRKEYPYWP